MALSHSLQALSEPGIAPRARAALGMVAVAGVVLLFARPILPRRPAFRRIMLPAFQSGFLYLLVGLGCRFVVQHHRSRLQIVVLLLAVAVIEVARCRRGGALPRAATWIVGSAAVCLGVLMAKWALEPGALSDALRVAWDP